MVVLHASTSWNSELRNMNGQPVIVEIVFNTPISKVWNAIATNVKMKKWYFVLPEFKAEIGFKFQFDGGPSPEKQYTHLCEVTELLSEKRLSYSWQYAGYVRNSFVTFDLDEQGNKTLLTLTNKGIETFPRSNPDFA